MENKALTLLLTRHANRWQQMALARQSQIEAQRSDRRETIAERLGRGEGSIWQSCSKPFVTCLRGGLVTAVCLLPLSLFCGDDDEEFCGYSDHSQRIEIKHLEFRGIGYKQGYTSFMGFFTMPSLLETPWVPFLDVRAHVFNTNGKPAVNAGIGLRYLSSMAYGINLYYDYRDAHYHYNQIGLGLEALGKLWDFRINGYLPVGHTHSRFYHTKFDSFDGHRMFIKQRQEFVMGGVNAEVGIHALDNENYNLYAAFGPYYFAKFNKNAIGGEGRMALNLYGYGRIQLQASWDPVFGSIAQGEISAIWPFGGTRTIKRKRSYSCSHELTLRERALQRVDRFEMIVLKKRHHKSVAKNPKTDKPYTFWFVDNTSHSNGTFESPFNTLAAAQNASASNDVIYVFPGDGTDNGMSSGITLKNGQFFFASSKQQVLPTTAGNIKIPAFSSTKPHISNRSLNVPVIQLSSGSNQVSGFAVEQTQTSFCLATPNGGPKGDYTITENLFTPLNGVAAINLNNESSTSFDHNTIVFSDFAGTSGIVVGSSASGNIAITNNLIEGSSPTTGFTTAIDMTAIAKPLSFTIQSNIIDYPVQPATVLTGIAITTNVNVPVIGTILSNNFNLPTSVNAATTGLTVTDTAAPFKLIVSSNTVSPFNIIVGYKFVDTAPPGFFQLTFTSDNIGFKSGP